MALKLDCLWPGVPSVCLWTPSVTTYRDKSTAYRWDEKYQSAEAPGWVERCLPAGDAFRCFSSVSGDLGEAPSTYVDGATPQSLGSSTVMGWGGEPTQLSLRLGRLIVYIHTFIWLSICCVVDCRRAIVMICACFFSRRRSIFVWFFESHIFFGHPMALRLEQHVGLVDLFQIEMKHDIT